MSRADLIPGSPPGGFTAQQVLLADVLYSAALQSTPIGNHMWRWMSDWRAGDVVIERSTRHSKPWSCRIGVMLREYDEPLLDEDGKQFSTDRHWVIATNAGEFDWHNAGFLRVPATEHQVALFECRAQRCIVLGDCRDCAREQWRKREGSALWEQVLRSGAA